jgi:hypothetical protein
MIRMSELSGPSKKGLELLNRMRKIEVYLYSGEGIEYNGYTYKMDGDLNPYIVGYCSSGDVPMFRNEGFWNEVIDIAKSMTDEEFDKINAVASMFLTMNI